MIRRSALPFSDLILSTAEKINIKYPAEDYRTEDLSVEDYRRQLEKPDSNISRIVFQRKRLTRFIVAHIGNRLQAPMPQKRALARFIEKAHGNAPPLTHLSSHITEFSVETGAAADFARAVGGYEEASGLVKKFDEEYGRVHEELLGKLSRANRLGGGVPGAVAFHSVAVLPTIIKKAQEQLQKNLRDSRRSGGQL